MKKLWSIMLGVLLLLSACSGQTETGSAPEEEKQSEEKTKMTVMLDWYPNAVHSFLYTAKEKGYFADEGLDVDFKFPANPTDPLNMTAAGEITLGLTYQPDVIMAREKGLPVKSVAAIVRSPLNHVVFPEGSDIQSPKDLEGKTIGYPGIPINEPIIQTMIKNDGGDPEKAKMTDIGFELVSAIATERVDAVSGAYINHEVPILESKGHPVRYFDPSKYGVPNYYELVMVTSDDTWSKDEEAIRSFMDASRKAFNEMKAEPNESLETLLENQDEANFPLDKEIEEESLQILLPKMETEDEAFGTQTKKSWEETAQWLKETGLVTEIPNLDEIFVNISE
ncbi:ABC transporter substrate-binding protein [Bacillus tianshenii]|nr:ABC transporter substrate-binding protein [Bacillus tianshenii]